MKNKLIGLCFLGIMAFYFCPSSGRAQTWTLIAAPDETWRSVTCSSDGTRLIAAGDDGIFGSLDGGLTWLFLNSNASGSVACSANGTKIIASASGAVYTSADWEQPGSDMRSRPMINITWHPPPTEPNWWQWDTAEFLAQFICRPIPEVLGPCRKGRPAFWLGNLWSSVASSADGTKLVVAAETTEVNGSFLPGPIYTSANSGASWTLSGAPSNVWYSVACSADGTKLVAAAYAGPSQIGGTGLIYISSDSGVTWTNVGPPTNYWMSVASSTNGTHLIAVSLFDQGTQNPGVIWRSTNSGVNWNKDALTGYFDAAATSADGTILASTDVARDQIYTFGEPLAIVPHTLPVLSAALAGNQLSLTWGISNSAGFLLFSTTNLAPPATWSQVTNLPTLGTDQIQVTLPCLLPSQFFRLTQETHE